MKQLESATNSKKKFEYPQQWGIYLITDGYLYTEYYM